MRKIIILSFILSIKLIGFCQTAPNVSIEIIGNTSSLEGETEVYTIRYSSTLPFSSLNYVPTVIGSSNITYVSGAFEATLTVRWNCLTNNGRIRILETTTNTSSQVSVALYSYTDPDFCKPIQSPSQFVFINTNPSQLSVYGSRYCTAAYSFSYQWQEVVDVANPISFTNIPGATGEFYTPPTSSTIVAKAYRRVTSFNISGVPYTINSNIAYVTFYNQVLNPGSISCQSFAYPNSIVPFYQNPAEGGPCLPTDFIYTWESSTDLTYWDQISQDVNGPIDFVFPGEIYVRRSVQCGNDIEFSNVVIIKKGGQLNPGAIDCFDPTTYEILDDNDPPTTLQAFNIPVNSLPTILEILPASDGLCDPLNYIYTWEKKRNVPFAEWEPIGTGVNYPAIPIAANCFIRRKITCEGEFLYTNEVYIKMKPYVSANTENLNYVRTNIIAIPGVSTLVEADVLATGNKLQSTDYLDGFGRTIQTVVKEGSLKQANTALDPTNVSNYRDLVTHNQYDQLGRMDKSFLPFATNSTPGFFKVDAANEQKNFNNQKYGEPATNIYTYAFQTNDGSPLNRVINSKTPGAFRNNNAAYKGISNDYSIYKAVENVRIWNIGYLTTDVPISGTNDIYADDKLIKNITKDEKDKMIVEYVDFSGNTILKKVQELELGAGLDVNGYAGWISTYYVYDDFNRLRYTITPKAVAQMANANPQQWVVTPDIKAGLCFYQEYDKKGRVTVKHSPDGGEVWSVYDNRDRQVLTQDEKQRNRNTEVPAKPNQWSYALYDDQDRPIASGLINDTRARVAMQNFVDALVPTNKQVDVYTGSWETLTAYNPAAGKINATPGFYCQACTESINNSVNYYDSYTADAKPYVNKQNGFFPPTNNPYPIISKRTFRTIGMLTGSKIRILDDKYDNGILTDDRFLIATNYMDEKGRLLQTSEENIKAGTDVVIFQYDFAGKVLASYAKHVAPSTQFSGIITSTKNEYDLLGRQTKVLKLYTDQLAKIGNLTNFKKLSEVDLDEFGRAKTKKIGADPNNTSTPLEVQDYSYNIQGELTGINKDYAGLNAALPQFNKHFGMYIGYENADNTFTDAQWNGSITGVIWRSQGDNYVRKYNYEYDNLNRFKAARFTQKQTPSSNAWSSSIVDLTATVDGYDENGNIKFLKHTGIVPGTNGGVIIDNLQYQYYANSNKLKAVNDLAFGGNQLQNGKQGDFKDHTPANGIDYDYDKNGNLEYDKNKNIIDNGSTSAAPSRGIIYNFLDLPQQITIKDKSTTEYIYDASGNKLAKKVTQLTASPPPAVTSYYLGEFVYEENELQYILNEEGKLRIVSPTAAWSGPSGLVNYLEIKENVLIKGTPNSLTPALSTAKYGVWDYFIKDNLSNTRMVLTEENHAQLMNCSMEDADINTALEEQQTFGETGANNPLLLTRSDRVASGWPESNNGTAKVSRLLKTTAGAQTAIGPNALLKVMAGDLITSKAKYFYRHNGTNAGNQNVLNNVVTSFINAISSGSAVAGLIKDNAATLSGNNTGAGSPITGFLNGQPSPTQNTTPKAYLNIIFFDEQFKYVTENSTAIRVEDVAANTDKFGLLPLLSVPAPKNGYVYVYLSNESTNTPVYFDDFSVRHDRTAIVEDNAFYPFGLKIAGISAKAAIKPQTKYGYQGSFSEEDKENGYNEFALRSYDPQIGRWIQIDPFNEISSGYVGMGNDPINSIDKTGGGIFEGVNLAGRTLAGTLGGAIIGATAAAIAGKSDKEAAKWIGYGALIGGGATFFSSSPISINVQFVPNWRQVINDMKTHKFSAYLGAKLRSILNEIFSLGKIVTITGDGFIGGDLDADNLKLTKGSLTTNLIKYFKNHPNAKRVANAFTEFHSDKMGDGENHGASQFKGIAEYFDENSCFLYGNCYQADEVETTSATLKNATVIGSNNQQLDLPFVLGGTLSGNPFLANDADEDKLIVAPSTPTSPTTLNSEFLLHKVAQNGNTIYEGRLITKINFSGRISYEVVGEAKARIMNDIYFKIRNDILKNIFSFLKNGF